MSRAERETSTIVLAALLIAALCGFVASFVVASLEMNLGEGLRVVASTWWGVVTLADLGAGLVFIALWIALLERRVWPTAAWIVGLFLLGNFTTLAYLLVRCFRYRTLREVVLGAPRSSSR